VVIGRHTGHSKWRAIVLFSPLSVVANMTVPDSAHAQGFFDFLFGSPQLQLPPSVGPAAEDEPGTIVQQQKR
jgi:hypothetical protein